MTPERLNRVEELVEYPTYNHGLVKELIAAVRETHDLYRAVLRDQTHFNLRVRSAIVLGAGSSPVETELEVETVGDTAERLAKAIKAVE